VREDPEMKRKLIAIEDLMRQAKMDFEIAQKELAERDAKNAAEMAREEANRRLLGKRDLESSAYTPVTGRSKKGIPVHRCDICKPAKV
jgi:hypothetical protein